MQECMNDALLLNKGFPVKGTGSALLNKVQIDFLTLPVTIPARFFIWLFYLLMECIPYFGAVMQFAFVRGLCLPQQSFPIFK
jgi:hypothetical protein